MNALQVYRIARQTTNLLDEVRFLGGVLTFQLPGSDYILRR